jgi:hypothetical protein
MAKIKTESKQKKGVEKLTVVEIGVQKLTPNPWNPNRMSDEMMAAAST